MDLFEVLNKLEKVKKVGNEYIAECPCHEDKHQSLSIRQSDEKILLYCHAGCEYKNLALALGLNGETPELIEEAIYDYVDKDGELIYQVIRYKGKKFKQRNANGDWSIKGINPILYKLPEIIEAIKNDLNIFIVEGEKDVETLNSHGIIATTLSGGANKKWSPENIETFQDANVILLPDMDSAGKKYMEYVASLLYGWCKSLKLIELDIKSGKDVTDYLQDHDSLTLLNIADNSPQYKPLGAVSRDEFNALKYQTAYLQRKIKYLELSKSKPLDKSKYTIKE